MRVFGIDSRFIFFQGTFTCAEVGVGRPHWAQYFISLIEKIISSSIYLFLNDNSTPSLSIYISTCFLCSLCLGRLPYC